MRSDFRTLIVGFKSVSSNKTRGGRNSQGGLSPWEKSDRKLDKYGGFIMFFLK